MTGLESGSPEAQIDSGAVLQASGLVKRYGELVVLGGVDLSVGPREAIGIVGPNGAGKTTLLSVLAGTVSCDAGTVRFRDHDITGVRADRRCRLGIARAYQVPRPFSGMTVLENVIVGATHGADLRGQVA